MASTPTTLTVRDSIPKIGGSTAGFIVLIVCLAVVIVISLLVIMYLLREDCVLGRLARRRQHRYERSTSTSAFIYHEPSKRQTWSWMKGLPKLPHLRNPAIDLSSRGLSGSIPMRDGRGWYQTGSDDIWDHTVPQLTGVRNPLGVEYATTPRTSAPPLSDAHEHRTSVYQNDSPASSGVRFELLESRKLLPEHPKRDLSSLYPIYAATEIHPSSPPPLPNSPIPVFASSSSLRSGSPMPRRAVSPVPPGSDPTSPVDTAIQTFEGGSKFLEAL
ncbi:hypothetical protein AX15_004898 [Amanita polypyramis BW_CC]|nr:hypothetical protein AX15_004898 [Amanita polypyramis BW_CC]